MKRTVFFISDGTGITAETLGHSLLTQFEQFHFEKTTIPYIDTTEKAEAAVQKINFAAQSDGYQPLIFSTLVNPGISNIIAASQGLLLDFFKTFIDPLEAALQTPSSHHVGRMHGVVNDKTYMNRIEAVNYALSHDDGLRVQNYQQADIILIGVSRCGKTPTCLYLALQFGLFAANYPFTEEDMDLFTIPEILKPYRDKLFGLTIEPERLRLIREERRPNSRYASLKQCQTEIQKVETFFKHENIPFLSSTSRSIEEIASSILATMDLRRRLD